MTAPGSPHGSLLFVYGTLRSGCESSELMEGCTFVRAAQMPGILYDIGGEYPALVCAGDGNVEGELWRCPPEVVARLDRFEGVAEGLFRRARVRLDGRGCWVYVAGPALGEWLTPEHRIPSGRWPGSSG